MKGFRAFEAGDWKALEEVYAPDMVMDPPPGWPEADQVRGWRDVQAQLERLKADWREDRVTILSVEEPSPDTVVVHMRWGGTGAASGMDVEMPFWAVYRVGAGRVVRATFLRDEGAALAAATGPDA